MNRLGIEMLTLLGMPPVEQVRIAAELGCASISAGLSSVPWEMFGITDFDLYPAWSLRDDPAMRRELVAAMRDTGVVLALGEGIVLQDARRADDFVGDLDLMAELGAVRINGVGMDSDAARCRDGLIRLAELTAERGMLFTMEFCPVFTIDTIEATLALVGEIGRGRASVLIDSMHFFRGGGSVQQLQDIDPASIGYVQLADSRLAPPDETYMAEAMFARDLPGSGELPLGAFIAALPADVTISVEIPRFDDMMSGLSPRDHAARAVKAARGLGA